ncbi:hypothetical protein AGMMS49965_05710 [Bacteroidia bacterium]|nr:hypothetical protein AGMMS49965_05710 [Bacteroidia bacterium]
MEKIGLVDRIALSVHNIYLGRKGLATEGGEIEGRILLSDGLLEALTVFKEAGANANNDIETVILVDIAYLTVEQHHCRATETGLLTSMNVAIESFKDALRAYKAVQDAVGYKTAEMTYSRQQKYRYRGMPKDAFHNACLSHRARLNNNLRTAGINDIELDVYKQRITNMIAVQSAYLARQQSALAPNN